MDCILKYTDFDMAEEKITVEKIKEFFEEASNNVETSRVIENLTYKSIENMQ